MPEETVVQTPEDRQATAILRALERWISAAPGRSVTVALTPVGWRARLDARQTAGGETLSDALAQVAQVAAVEVAP